MRRETDDPRNAASYREFPPPADLSDRVACTWVRRVGAASSHPQPIIPDRFRPGAARAVLKCSAGELLDCNPALQELDQRGGSVLADELGSAPSATAKRQAMEHWIRARTAGAGARPAGRPSLSLAGLAREAGLLATWNTEVGRWLELGGFTPHAPALSRTAIRPPRESGLPGW